MPDVASLQTKELLSRLGSSTPMALAPFHAALSNLSNLPGHLVNTPSSWGRQWNHCTSGGWPTSTRFHGPTSLSQIAVGRHSWQPPRKNGQTRLTNPIGLRLANFFRKKETAARSLTLIGFHVPAMVTFHVFIHVPPPALLEIPIELLNVLLRIRDAAQTQD